MVSSIAESQISNSFVSQSAGNIGSCKVSLGIEFTNGSGNGRLLQSEGNSSSFVESEDSILKQLNGLAVGVILGGRSTAFERIIKREAIENGCSSRGDVAKKISGFIGEIRSACDCCGHQSGVNLFIGLDKQVGRAITGTVHVVLTRGTDLIDTAGTAILRAVAGAFTCYGFATLISTNSDANWTSSTVLWAVQAVF
jgi:hypothetical protein